MKKIVTLFCLFTLLGCEKEPNVSNMEELIHGDWYGVEITNHLIAQGLWDTLHPHSITNLVSTFDTLNSTFVVDSLGETIDSASLTINSDSVVTVVGAVNAIDWSFDRTMINDLGQPVLEQLESSFTGNQRFRILSLSDEELVLYFDQVIPVSISGFTANMELRHTEYWRR